LKYLIGCAVGEICALGRSGAESSARLGVLGASFFDHGQIDLVVLGAPVRRGCIAIDAGSAFATVAPTVAKQISAANVVSQAFRMAGPP
jgi:hypothetical protein